VRGWRLRGERGGIEVGVYQFVANSNAAPFVSDTSQRFIDAETAMEALKKGVDEYSHPAGLYSAMVETCEEDSKVVARYLSERARRQEKAPCGVTRWEGDKLIVDGVEQPPAEELYEDKEAPE